MRIACFFVMVSLGSPVLARDKVEKFVEEHQLMPLAKSDYWKQNPGILPYEECKLVSASGHRIRGHGGAATFGATKFSQKFTIFCFSKSLKLGFQIPIEIDKDFSAGLGGEVNLVSYTKGHIRHLNNKNLMDIYGNFKGAKIGFGVGASFGATALFHNGIVLTLNDLSASMLAAFAGIRKVHLGTRSLLEYEVYKPLYLQRRAEYLEKAKRRFDDIFKQGSADDYITKLDEEGMELQNWDDEAKYSSTWKFWIHHLKEDGFDKHQCQQQYQRQCNSAQMEYVKMFGEPDFEFLSTLTFREI